MAECETSQSAEGHVEFSPMHAGVVKACALLMAGKEALGVSTQADARPMDLRFTGVSRKVALTDAMSQGSTMG